jgi:hypothetical protein
LATDTQRLWYLRLGGQIRGPFPTAAVAQDLASGRLPPHALLSADQISWIPASGIEAFSQLLQPGASDAWADERRQALRRWADERSGQERRTSADARGGGDRRREAGSARAVVDGVSPSRAAQGRTWLVIGGLAAAVLVLLLLAVVFGPAGTPEVRLLK